MVINIPVQIDDATMEGKIKEEYKSLVSEKISNIILEDLAEDCGHYYRFGESKEVKAKDMIVDLTKDKIDDFFEDHKDEILKAIVDKLWDRAKNRRAVKDAANSAVGNLLQEA